MTRRERAAMTLALECLRDSGWDGHGRDSAARNRVSNAWEVACFGEPSPLMDAVGEQIRVGKVRPRFLRARLALALRAMLRVAAIEHAEAHDEWWCHDSTRTRVVCSGCGEEAAYKHGELMERRWDGSPDLCPKTGRIERARNAIPLWEQAPSSHPGQR